MIAQTGAPKHLTNVNIDDHRKHHACTRNDTAVSKEETGTLPGATRAIAPLLTAAVVEFFGKLQNRHLCVIRQIPPPLRTNRRDWKLLHGKRMIFGAAAID